MECEDAIDAEAVFAMICDAFTVLRIKNGFADKSAGVTFRQILINVAHTDPETGFV